MNPQDLLDIVFASGPHPQWPAALRDVLERGFQAASALPTPQEQMEAHRRNYAEVEETINNFASEAGMHRMLKAGLWHFVPEGARGHTEPPQPVITSEEFKEMVQYHPKLVQGGCTVNRVMRTRVRQQYRDRVERIERGDTLCGTYPFRQVDQGDVHVAEAISPWSSSSRSGKRYAYADVAPFVQPELSEEARAALYQSRLQVRLV